jgi:hypothetical protein
MCQRTQRPYPTLKRINKASDEKSHLTLFTNMDKLQKGAEMGQRMLHREGTGVTGARRQSRRVSPHAAITLYGRHLANHLAVSGTLLANLKR